MTMYTGLWIALGAVTAMIVLVIVGIVWVTIQFGDTNGQTPQ